MEDNRYEYGFGGDGQSYEDSNYMYKDQDTAYVIRPEQMGGGEFQQPQMKRMIPIVTITLILANVIAGIMCIGVDNYSRTGGLNYEYVKLNKEYGRLLSSMFLHSGFDHLVGNMFALFMFGSTVEKKLGSLRMTIIYFVSGIVSGLISMNLSHVMDPSRMHFSIGASGAVFGVMCAAVFLSVMGSKKASRRDMIIAIVLVVIYAIYTYEENIDIYAHIGGAVVGGILAFALNVRKWERFRENKFFKVLAIMLTVILSIAGIGEAGIGKAAADLPDKRIDFIKEQTVFENDDTTYGEGLDLFCTDEHWSTFISTDGDDIVEFDGNAEYKGAQVTVLIQFRIVGDCDDYKLGYFGINDQGQDSRGAADFMEAVCERAGQQ